MKDKGLIATTGVFLAFGTKSHPGQVVRGELPCHGALMRVPLQGGELELVAWGFRNPFGLAFAPDGRLFATDHGYDHRGIGRGVEDAPDLLWVVQTGLWYGWPDFAGGIPLSDERFGKTPLVLAKTPNPPPRPVATFEPHSGASGLDFSRSEAFGFVGQAFVAEVGDGAPATGRVPEPRGFRVVVVDVASGSARPFVANRAGRGPASKLDNAGLERPVAVRFDPSGQALYIVDFGVMTASPFGSKKGAEGAQAVGPYPRRETGVLWRVTRVAAPPVR